MAAGQVGRTLGTPVLDEAGADADEEGVEGVGDVSLSESGGGALAGEELNMER